MEINVKYDNGKVVDNDKKEIGIEYDGNFYKFRKNHAHQLELQQINQGTLDNLHIIDIVSRDGLFGKRTFLHKNGSKYEAIKVHDDDTGWSYKLSRDRKGPGQYNNENIDLIYLDPKKKIKVAAAITAGTLALLIPLSLHFKGNEIRNKIWNRPTTTQETHNENSENQQIHTEITERYKGSLSPKSAYLNEDVYEVDINGKNGKKKVIFYITGGKSENGKEIPAAIELKNYYGKIKKLKVGKEIPGVGYEITGISKEDEKLIGKRELYVNDKGNIGTYYGP